MESAAGSEPLGFGGPPRPKSTQKFHIHMRKVGTEVENVTCEAQAPLFSFPFGKWGACQWRVRLQFPAFFDYQGRNDWCITETKLPPKFYR